MRFRLWLENVELPNKLYHGTAAEFGFFDPNMFGQRDWGDFGLGVYLTPKANLAKAYAIDAAKRTGTQPVILVVQHSLKSPANFDDENLTKQIVDATGVPIPKKITPGIKQTRPKNEAEEITKYLLSKGFDCGVGRNMSEIAVYNPQLLHIIDRKSLEDADYLP